MPQDAQKIVPVLQSMFRAGRDKLGARWTILLLIAIGGYLFAEPALEARMGLDLPGIHTPGELSSAPSKTREGSDNRTTTRSDSPAPISLESLGSILEKVGRETYRSEAGLIYTRGSFHGHRLKHLMSHAKDDPSRPGSHGVFDATDPSELLELVDEVYLRAIRGDYDEKESESGREVFTVDAGRRVGYIGGQSGGRRNHPPARHIRLVVDGGKLITAYPVRP